MKTKRDRKWEIPHTVLKKQSLCFSSYKNRKLKVKLWWVGARERKKRASFLPFFYLFIYLFIYLFFDQRKFFNICVLSQCIVEWIHFQNINAFTYQKTLLHRDFCLFLRHSEALSVSLSRSYPFKFLRVVFHKFYLVYFWILVPLASPQTSSYFLGSLLYC